jgi:hypothetical protein
MRRVAWLALLALGACAAPGSQSPAPAAVVAPKPAATPVSTMVAIVNADFDSPRPGDDGNPEGWATSQHAGDKSYEFVLDPASRHTGTQSLRIRNIGSEPYGGVHQAVPAGAMRGRTVQLAAWLRTEGANGEGAMLTLRALAAGGLAAHKFMDDPPATGTRDWRRYAITLAVPPNAEVVDFGAMLVGSGTLWLDSVELVLLP